MGPSWELIALGAVSMVIALIGAYAKGLSGRQDKFDAKLSELNDALLRNYHPKPDVKEMLDDLKEVVGLFHVEMKASFRELKDRFDRFEQIYGR